jgi:hypothetical protein
MRSWGRTLLLAATMTATAAAVVSVPTASALAPVDPWGTVSGWSNGIGNIVTGADPVTGWVDSAGTPVTSTVDSTWTKVGGLQEAAQVVPKFWKPTVASSLGGLNTIVLGATAFGIGWKIGSTVNTKWFHIAGVGLGTYTGDPGGFVTKVEWMPLPNAANLALYGIPNGTPVWEAKLSYNGGSDTVFVDPANAGSTACGAGTLCRLEWNYIQSKPELSGHLVGPNTTSFGAHYLIVMTESQMKGALPVDQPVQPLNTQPFGITSGWPTPSGCGDTTAPCTYPGAQPQPKPCVTIASTGVAECIASGGAPSGTWTIPSNPLGDPLPQNDPNGNLIRCRVDPAHYACPTINGPGTDYGKSGGAVGNWTVPAGCLGATVIACEALIDAAADGANAPHPAYTEIPLGIPGAVLTYPAGAVATITPAPSTVIDPSATPVVQLGVNPDPLPVILPTPGPWVLGEPYCDELTAAGLTCVLVPLNVPDPLHGPSEVTHVSLQPGSRQAPGTTVTVQANPVTASGDPVPYPPGDPNDPGTSTPPPSPIIPIPGGGGTCNCPAFDFTPLTGLALGSKFPFGVFAYASGIIGEFNVEPHAPDFAFTAPSLGGNATGAYDVNLGSPRMVSAGFDQYMGWWRTLLSFAMWIGAIYWVGTRLIGFGAAGDPAAAMDDVDHFGG